MSEHPDTRDLLGPYVMGTLDAHEEHEVEDHLQSCADCRREALELRLAHERLTDLARSFEAPPDDLKERVVAGLPQREARRRVPRWVAAVAAAFCVLAVIGAVLTPDLSKRGDCRPARANSTTSSGSSKAMNASARGALRSDRAAGSK